MDVYDAAISYRANRMLCSEEELNGKYGQTWRKLKEQSKEYFWKYVLKYITNGAVFYAADSEAEQDFLSKVSEVVEEEHPSFRKAYRILFPKEVARSSSVDQTLLGKSVMQDLATAEDVLNPIQERVDRIYDDLYFQAHCFYDESGTCSNPLIGDGVGGTWDESVNAWVFRDGNMIGYDHRFCPRA